MFVRILLIVIILVLGFVANYLHKNSTQFSKVLAEEQSELVIQQLFKRFAQTCLVLAITGLPVILLGDKLIAIGYVALILFASAIFSILLSKAISS